MGPVARSSVKKSDKEKKEEKAGREKGADSAARAKHSTETR